MNKKIISAFFLSLFFLSFNAQGVEQKGSDKKGGSGPTKLYGEAGLNIPSWGIGIDGVYDPRLDDLVPRYKILNIVITNRGKNTLILDPKKDRWRIKDSLGSGHTAINHLRFIDEKIWMRLPEDLKRKLDYPLTVRAGYTTKVDVFFKDDVELTNFKEISWFSSSLKKYFIFSTTLAKTTDEASGKSEPIPQNKN